MLQIVIYLHCRGQSWTKHHDIS